MANAGDDGSHEQQPGSRSRGFIPPHGGYEDLLTFRKTRIIYDGTVRFCDRFVDFRSRTRDQMVQAARSGKQNILEGSQASGTSRETEIKLTSVARASLEELLEDYRDYLRVNNAAQWDRNSEEALFVRQLGAREGVDYEAFREYFDTRPAEVVAEWRWQMGLMGQMGPMCRVFSDARSHQPPCPRPSRTGDSEVGCLESQ